MKYALTTATLMVMAISGAVTMADDSTGNATKQSGNEQMTISKDSAMVDYSQIPFNTIKGEKTNLAAYLGHPVLIVNTASECGFTRQYAGLQDLYEKYHDRGLTVIGFPANNFGEQEPGDDSTIAAFCDTTFGVTFPMMSKVSVKGDDIHPLFKALLENAESHDDIPWNFHKFLLDKNGKVIGRYGPKVEPMSDELTSKIESAL